MNTSQYRDYLRDRQTDLDKGLKKLKSKLGKMSDTLRKSSEHALDYIAMGKMQQALITVNAELRRIEQPVATCKRCGVSISPEREQVLAFTLYCQRCSN